MTKILIAYFSHSGNTRTVAEQIQKMNGGDLFEIRPLDDYPINYDACVKQAKQEIEKGHKPELDDKLYNIGQYNAVFLGSPVWWYTIAPPVATFLSEYDLSGKKIAPFCTHEGSGLSNCALDIAKMNPGATVLEGIAFRGSRASQVQKELTDWIVRINP